MHIPWPTISMPSRIDMNFKLFFSLKLLKNGLVIAFNYSIEDRFIVMEKFQKKWLLYTAFFAFTLIMTADFFLILFASGWFIVPLQRLKIWKSNIVSKGKYLFLRCSKITDVYECPFCFIGQRLLLGNSSIAQFEMTIWISKLINFYALDFKNDLS